jgi:hypothetical protein
LGTVNFESKVDQQNQEIFVENNDESNKFVIERDLQKNIENHDEENMKTIMKKNYSKNYEKNIAKTRKNITNKTRKKL